MLTACLSDSETISIVKNGHLNNYPNKSVGEAIDGFFGNPKWSSGVTEDGTQFVNVTGNILYHEKDVEAVLQFFVNSEKKEFEINALEINEIPQDQFMIFGLIEKIHE